MLCSSLLLTGFLLLGCVKKLAFADVLVMLGLFLTCLSLFALLVSHSLVICLVLFGVCSECVASSRKLVRHPCLHPAVQGTLVFKLNFGSIACGA